MVEQNHLASTEWVDIVSEENEVIAQASREQMRAERLRHRATYIVVHDGMGKILVQRRTDTKDFLPGMLDATAGGVVQADEVLLDSARREAEEELGIAGVPFAEHGQFYFEDEHLSRLGRAVQLRFPRTFRLAGRGSERSVLDDAGRDHRALRRVHAGFP
jgi:NTP pyrophosphohydrolases including oxidative damage repair enzymes